MSLPESEELDVASLSGVFQNTTNSYKFYWFLAILDSLQEDGEQLTLTKKDLALHMLTTVWYPLSFYKLSFGSQDSFKDLANTINSKVKIDDRINAPDIIAQISQKLSEKEVSDIEDLITEKLERYVISRFIRPFFNSETRGLKDSVVNQKIQSLCTDLFETKSNRVIYRITKESIILNPIWAQYLQKHQSILRGFIHWHLVRFVQKNNPNVISLTEKLEKPVKRDLTLAGRFWKGFLAENPEVACIYSGEPVSRQNLSLDHFLPWSYVAHDQLWNIIPTSISVNSSKGNSLPFFDLYFDKFSDLQFRAVQFYLEHPKSKLLVDYQQLLGESKLEGLSQEEFRLVLKKQLMPLLLTAQNMGFGLYIYGKPTQ